MQVSPRAESLELCSTSEPSPQVAMARYEEEIKHAAAIDIRKGDLGVVAFAAGDGRCARAALGQGR
jgi:hypothetical protein